MRPQPPHRPQPAKRTITPEQWEQKLSQVSVSKDDMNRLVMDFLVTEGYVDAARAFQGESGAPPGVDLGDIAGRMEIRAAVQGGRVEDAIDRVNDLDPEILEEQQGLLFHLQQQRLIEMIRDGRTADALDFAREYLAPAGEENPEFLDELERTVALLAFDDPRASPVGDLMDAAQRQKTASELNAAILSSQCHETEPRLALLLKALLWAQARLEERAAFPKIVDLVAAAPGDK
ncbi:MAG: CTLH/CRA C-terminal to lish motif domain-containing protein [Monoraphidium minutum]|nr:MAG: CTLH/CRA C-terminal to lish motif domain-containing protein [Monoraphidium minutum]